MSSKRGEADVYTPTTLEVANTIPFGILSNRLIDLIRDEPDFPTRTERRAAMDDFDRWLARVRAEAKAEALEEAGGWLTTDQRMLDGMQSYGFGFSSARMVMEWLQDEFNDRAATYSQETQQDPNEGENTHG